MHSQRWLCIAAQRLKINNNNKIKNLCCFIIFLFSFSFSCSLFSAPLYVSTLSFSCSFLFSKFSLFLLKFFTQILFFFFSNFFSFFSIFSLLCEGLFFCHVGVGVVGHAMGVGVVGYRCCGHAVGMVGHWFWVMPWV